jgi:hypothetical protein
LIGFLNKKFLENFNENFNENLSEAKWLLKISFGWKLPPRSRGLLNECLCLSLLGVFRVLYNLF